MNDVCIKCGNRETYDDNSSKVESYGCYNVCRACYRPILKKHYELIDMLADFYVELEKALLKHPERLNPEDASDSVCDSLNSDYK